jgi:ribosomal protein L30/L7E
VRNVLAKSYGSRNPINVVRATVNALANARSPEDIAGQAWQVGRGDPGLIQEDGHMANKQITVTLAKSLAGQLKNIQASVRGLGLRRRHQTVQVLGHSAEPRNDLCGQAPADGAGVIRMTMRLNDMKPAAGAARPACAWVVAPPPARARPAAVA